MAGTLTQVTDTNFDAEVLEAEGPVLVDFWAPWCGPCRALGPVIDKIATQFAGKVKVGKLNTDDNQDIAVRYGISAIPQVFIFKGGDEPKQRIVGAVPEAEITKAINRVIEG